MKLLLDQNLAARLVPRLAALFPGSSHVRLVGLQSAPDAEIWDYARLNGFAIVSKDSDFHQLSFLRGAPPKVIWVRRGNCTVAHTEQLLREQASSIQEFGDDEEATLLILG